MEIIRYSSLSKRKNLNFHCMIASVFTKNLLLKVCVCVCFVFCDKMNRTSINEAPTL